MPKYTVTLWETREYIVPVEADDEDAAREIAEERYADLFVRDQYVSLEIRDVEPGEQ